MATPNYALPEIVVGQRNKEITHNTAIRLIEGVLGGIVDKDLTTPPTLVEGNAYLIPSGASGAWSGKTNNIAIAVNGAWEFIEPSTRLGVIFVKDESRFYRYNGSAWVEVAISASTVELTTELKSSSFTPAAGVRYLVDTSGGAIAVTLPASPILGNIVEFADGSNTDDADGFTLFNLTINPNTGHNVQGNTSLVLDKGGQAVRLCFNGASRWNIIGGIS